MNTRSNSYRIRVINSLDTLAGMAKEWNDLLQDSKADTVFLTWDWLHTWTECFLDEHRQLFVLAIYAGNDLIGLAPWYIRRIRTGGVSVKRIEFLGSPECGSDYLDVVAKKRREKDVAQAVYQFLFNDSPASWDTVLFRDVPSDSLFLLFFLEQFERDGKYVEVEPGSFCPVVFLPGDRNSFLKDLTQHRRQQYLRASRQLQKEGEVIHRCIASGDGVAALSEFHALYGQRRQKSEKELRFMERLFSRCFYHGMCEINFLTINDQNCAATLQLRHDKTVFLYHLVADRSFASKLSIGNFLVGQCIEKAIDEEFSTYDFLKGSEEYKFYWANSGRRSLHLIFHGKKLAPALKMAVKGLKAAAKVLCR